MKIYGNLVEKDGQVVFEPDGNGPWYMEQYKFTLKPVAKFFKRLIKIIL